MLEDNEMLKKGKGVNCKYSLLLFVNKIMFTKCFFLLQKYFLFTKWVLFLLKVCFFLPWKGAFFKCFFFAKVHYDPCYSYKYIVYLTKIGHLILVGINI